MVRSPLFLKNVLDFLTDSVYDSEKAFSISKRGTCMEDEQIIGLFFARDEQAIAELKMKYGSRCLGIAEHILQNREDAEECVSDALVRVWNSVPPNRPNQLSAYLAALVRNLALDRWRQGSAKKRGGSQTELAIDELGEILIGAENVEEAVEAAELAAEISCFVRSLPPKRRSLFVRRYFQVDSLERLAADFHMSKNSVSAILSVLRRKLKSYLSERGYL